MRFGSRTTDPLRGLASLGVVLGLLVTIPGTAGAWGYAVHRLINRNAVANLPSDFSGFAQYAAQLEALATAADERKSSTPGENIRHYINIDEFAEFQAGTFPHQYADAVSRYGLSRLQSAGVGPWALENSYNQMVAAFVARDWTAAVAAAGDIGHYAGDLHQPLHLTSNYDGQESGQRGLHSRFESRLTGKHMTDFTPFPGAASFVADPLEREFAWINTTYPGVSVILAADLAAKSAAGGSTSSDTYYNSMWEQLGQDTWYWIGLASFDIASFWYSAWIEAGAPPLPGTSPVEPATWSRIKGLLVAGGATRPVRQPIASPAGSSRTNGRNRPGPVINSLPTGSLVSHHDCGE
ncbi:MAG TPA: hypothetical protein VF720_16350 [Candidatus Eisenbacteria bacterium]